MKHSPVDAKAIVWMDKASPLGAEKTEKEEQISEAFARER